MAKATKRLVEKLTPTQVEDGVTLELSHAEAKSLAVLMAHVGGCPATSGRHYIVNIDMALTGAGYDTYDNENLLSGSGAHFKDNTREKVEAQ